jgi:DNA-binding NtrC family response regulator
VDIDRKPAIQRSFNNNSVISCLALPSLLAPAETVGEKDDDSSVLSLSEFLERQERQERQYVLHILDRARGNVTRAAGLLKLPRQSLHRKLRELGIRRPDR